MPIQEGFRAHDNWLVEFADGLSAKMVDGTVLQYYRRHESNESQFIVNKTVPVSRLDVFKDRVKKAVGGTLNEALDMQILQRRFFVDGVSRALERNPATRVEKLNEMLECGHLEIDCLIKRAVIRALPLFPRIAGVVVIFLKGGYGLEAKSFFRDFLG